MDIKAIVFDFDGIIIDTETAWFESYRDALSAFGIDFPLDVFGRCVGTHNDELDRYMTERLPSAEDARTVHLQAAKLHRDRMTIVKAREGVESFLKEARRLGLRIGLATSSNRKWIDRFLDPLGFSGYFDVIRTSDDVANIKPDPELYLSTVQALGVVPAEAVAFEDSVNGSKAAIAAGLRCVIVPNPATEKLPFEGYDLRIRSMGDQPLAEILRLLERKDGKLS